jgi:hypothetical protein
MKTNAASISMLRSANGPDRPFKANMGHFLLTGLSAEEWLAASQWLNGFAR